MLGSTLLVGVDLVRVADVADAMNRFGDRYTKRIFTDREIAYCGGVPQLAAERFAVRFAAKEATTKLLRMHTDALIWRSIEVLRNTGGWCDILLHDEVRSFALERGIAGLALSMSHEHEYAIATVIGQRIHDQHADDLAERSPRPPAPAAGFFETERE